MEGVGERGEDGTSARLAYDVVTPVVADFTGCLRDQQTALLLDYGRGVNQKRLRSGHSVGCVGRNDGQVYWVFYVDCGLDRRAFIHCCCWHGLLA